MNQHIPTYSQWLTESLSRTTNLYRLDKLKWEFDQGAKDRLEKDRKGSEDAKVYVSDDKDRDLKYVFSTWVENSDRYIHLEENDKLVFSQQYADYELPQYNEDCLDILGFKIK
jgi:hypothetical protein